MDMMMSTFVKKIGFLTAGVATSLLVGLGGVSLANAATPVQMLIEKDWGAYRSDEGGNRTCFVSSVPTKKTGKYDPANRGDVRVFVSHGPGKTDRNVVQFLAGYKYKAQTDVSVKIDSKTFKLFTIEGRAFAESEDDDVAMIKAMRAGSKMVVVGVSSRGTKTTDTYSLSGFTKTKNLIDKTCK